MSLVTPSQKNPDPEEIISINWCFFSTKNPVFKPRPIEIPRRLYDSKSVKCQELFSKEIRKKYKFSTELDSIEFWRPKNGLLCDEEEWQKYLDASQRLPVPLPLSFSYKLTDTDDDLLVHLIVTADGFYDTDTQTVGQGDEVETYDTISAMQDFSGYKRALVPGRSPSQGAKSSKYRKVQSTEGEAIFDSRFPLGLQGSTIAPPIQIYHPIFDTFLALLNDITIQPTVHDIVDAQEFMKLLTLIYEPNEERRNTELRDRLKELLHPGIKEDLLSDRTRPDAILLAQGCIPLFIAEFKRELGEGGSDPSIQAGISMRRSWAQPRVKEIREKGCCPTLMLVGGGPWLGVLGGVFTDKAIVQRLTGLQWFGLSCTEEDGRVYELARLLLALRKSIHSLEVYYKELSEDTNIPPLSRTEPHPRFYPYPKSFTCNRTMVEFKYLTPLEHDPACVTFKAEVVHIHSGSANPVALSVGTKIVVKFVARYGEAVHRFLADESRLHAPVLYYCGSVYEGGLKGVRGPCQGAVPGLCLRSDLMHMVVMEYIEHTISDSVLSAESRKQVEDILKALHSNGYVFGDLRMPNILVDSAGKVKLIDFNWCGSYNPNISIQSGDIPEEVVKEIKERKEEGLLTARDFTHYPLSLSKSVHWPDGVTPLGPIRPEQDWALFNKLV